jgi:hypothetical protein
VLPLNYILPLDDKNFELLPFAANTASDGHLQKQPVLTQWQQIDGPTESPSDGDSVVALRQFAGTNPSADDSLPGGPLLGGPLADDSESIPPVSTVPEPASIALISCIFLALRRRR